MDPNIRPHADRAAIVTIDTQNDFSLPGGPAEIAGTAEVVLRMANLLETARHHGVPIVNVVRLYKADGSNVDRCRKRAIESGEAIVQPGTDGAELVDALKPDQNPRLDADRLLAGEFQEIGSREWVMYKPRWGAFFETDLDDFLSDRGIDTLVVCGCNFPNCPRTTVYEASERDYRIVLVPDATSGTYERGLEELADIGVAVWDTTETVEWLAA